MLTNISIAFALMLIAASLVQWGVAVWFRRKFVRTKNETAAASQPSAAVIMSVRGCDPSLRESLLGVIDQNYGDYSVHVVVDHPTDQAWEFIHQLKSEHDHRDVLKIHEMKNPADTCSLKCHAIVQALESVSPETHLIALLDADVRPHGNWLSELTCPLSDETVGAVTGNQWFEPESPANIGSLIRSSWNAGAMALTLIFCNPWAGSFAMRLKDIRRSGLLETWKRSIVDDGPIRNAVDNIGLKICYAPSLIMVNRETCSFSYVNRWVTRMLTWSRLYENTFFLTVLHAGFSNSIMFANFALFVVAIARQNWLAMAAAAAGLIVSGWLSVAAYVESRRCAQHSCDLRGQHLPPLSISRLVAIFWLAAVGQTIFGTSCLQAMWKKRITWRDITYQLESKDEIKRLDYRPYAPQQGNGTKVSI